jgi:hypothetical protein
VRAKNINGDGILSGKALVLFAWFINVMHADGSDRDKQKKDKTV